MSDEITLPITYEDLEAWRAELEELEPKHTQLWGRVQRLRRMIKAAEFIAAENERESKAEAA